MLDFDRYTRAKLLDRIDISEELAVFRFQPQDALDFTPGQYATLALLPEDGERPAQRPYSVASAPHEETIEVFVERADEGGFTPLLWELNPDDECWIRKRIVGRFTLDSDTSRPWHLMCATVTGIGPFVSIIRSLKWQFSEKDGEPPFRLVVLHGSSLPDELGPYREELQEDAANLNWVRYIPTISRPWNAPDWEGERGRVEDVLRKYTDRFGINAENAVAYSCGHPKMVRKTHAILQRTGFEDAYLREEVYFRE